MVEQNLRDLFEAHPGVIDSAEVISAMLKNTITSLDEDITRKILEIFVPPSAQSPLDLPTLQDEAMKALESMSDEEVMSAIGGGGGDNQARLLRGMRGSTALVVLIAPQGFSGHRGIWVASLGDCVAGEFVPFMLMSYHLGLIS